jgi:hypothetical protein
VRYLLITPVVIVVAFVGACTGDYLRLNSRAQRTIDQLHTEFPKGISFDAAKDLALRHYPRSEDIPASKCDSEQGVPAWPSRGGPCIFGYTESGSTFWGFEAGIMFRLMFGSDGRLVDLNVLQVNTFL